VADAKAFMTHVYETVRAGDLDGVVDLFAEACLFIDVTQPEPSQGRVAFRAYMEETFAGMPDFRPESWTFIAEGDHVAAELVLTGTHAGSFMGYAPTGRMVRWPASAFYTLNPEHDQVIREVYYYDLGSLTRQLAGNGA
jgi:steroid delta-isomerase-like uncharacterized protein